MNKFLLLLFDIICLFSVALSQTVEETYPKTIFCNNDLFLLKYDAFPELDTFKVSRTDKSSPGIDAALNAYATIYFNNDSLRLNYNNKLPYQHNFYINFESPKGKTTLRFHFNSVSNYFDKTYITQNTGKVLFDIPEMYELANIIWTLSPSGERANDLNKGGAYYKRVKDFFKPYLNHPIFKDLNFADTLYIDKYYDFRENSFAFNFKSSNPTKSEILFNGPYYSVFGDELADSSLFGKLKPLIEDFASQSKFRKFYRNNLSYYSKQIKREQILLPIKQMNKWLEEEFPKIKYHSYKVIFSPLIGGTHSTQGYSGYLGDKYFGEIVMFICNTDRVDKNKNNTERQKETSMSGVVFTEIDHNYVNPTSNKYRRQIDSIFSNRNIWVKNSVSSNYYENSISVFNEYMTWSVFCLYILDQYDEATATLVINARENVMINNRNFIKFREFNQELIRLRKSNKNLNVVQLYPLILDWCKLQL